MSRIADSADGRPEDQRASDPDGGAGAPVLVLVRPGDNAGGGPPETTLDLVYRRYGGDVSQWARLLSGPGHDLEDLVHDVFLVVERRLPEFRGEAKLSTWLYEITVRVVQDARRRSLRRQWVLGLFGRRPQAGLTAGHASPAESFDRREASQLLYRLLDQLDEKYRTAVVLFELEGLSCGEIALVTRTSVAGVWSRVSRGREMLVRAFAKWEQGKKTS